MAAKTKEQLQAEHVEAAIISLYDLFPNFSNCREVETTETIKITREIREREAVLANDAKLVALRYKLQTTKDALLKTATEQRRKIDSLRRNFRTRGVSEKLLAEIESIEKVTPIVKRHGCS